MERFSYFNNPKQALLCGSLALTAHFTSRTRGQWHCRLSLRLGGCFNVLPELCGICFNRINIHIFFYYFQISFTHTSVTQSRATLNLGDFKRQQKFTVIISIWERQQTALHTADFRAALHPRGDTTTWAMDGPTTSISTSTRNSCANWIVAWSDGLCGLHDLIWNWRLPYPVSECLRTYIRHTRICRYLSQEVFIPARPWVCSILRLSDSREQYPVPAS